MEHALSGEIPSKDLFMMCRKLNTSALSALPPGFHFRKCRRDELDVWLKMHLDTPELQRDHIGFMRDYFHNVYEAQTELFFEKCLFACNEDDLPIGSCFVWKAYGRINTIHWYKVIKEYEGRGIGRALLSEVMRELEPEDYPVYLHTHPSSFRAIKLYSDMGFCLVSNPIIGYRNNDLDECLPILRQLMPERDYDNLKIVAAPQVFLDAAASSRVEEF